MAKKNYHSEETITIGDNTITAYGIDSDVNGNPRYVVHFLDLGIELKDYGKVPQLKQYRAKWFGGGYVFQTYSIKDDLIWALGVVHDYYNTGEEN